MANILFFYGIIVFYTWDNNRKTPRVLLNSLIVATRHHKEYQLLQGEMDKHFLIFYVII